MRRRPRCVKVCDMVHCYSPVPLTFLPSILTGGAFWCAAPIVAVVVVDNCCCCCWLLLGGLGKTSADELAVIAALTAVGTGEGVVATLQPVASSIPRGTYLTTAAAAAASSSSALYNSARCASGQNRRIHSKDRAQSGEEREMLMVVV